MAMPATDCLAPPNYTTVRLSALELYMETHGYPVTERDWNRVNDLAAFLISGAIPPEPSLVK